MTSFWESVRKGLEEGVSAVKRGASVAKEMTEDTVKLSKLRYGIHGLRDEIKGMFAEVGGRVFDAIEEGKMAVPKDARVKELIGEIREHRKRIQEIESESRRGREEAAVEEAARPAEPREAAEAEPQEEPIPTEEELAYREELESKDPDAPGLSYLERRYLRERENYRRLKLRNLITASLSVHWKPVLYQQGQDRIVEYVAGYKKLRELCLFQDT